MREPEKPMSLSPPLSRSMSIRLRQLRTKVLPTIGRYFSLLFRIAIVTLTITTLVTIFANQHWFADLLANLRIQQCLALTAIQLIYIACRNWSWALIPAICIAIHLPWFLSAYPKHLMKQTSSESVTITLANVLTQNLRHDDIVADVTRHNPDVFVILELSSALADFLKQNLADTYPHRIIRPQDFGNFGMGLFSRFPIEDADVFTLNTEIESIAATVNGNDEAYRVFATHPLPPIGEEGYELRNADLTQLAAKIHEFQTQSPEVPVLLMGDLNLTPWSPHFGALEEASGLRRAIDRFNLTPTWYRYPWFPFGLVLDHVMINERLQCTNHIVGPDIGSDHRSVTVSLALAE